MSHSPIRPEPPDSERARARAVARLASRLDGARVAAHPVGTVIVPVGNARLVLTLGDVDAPRAFARFTTTSLAYAIDGELGAHADDAKRLLLAAASIAAELDASAGTSAPAPDATAVDEVHGTSPESSSAALESLVPAVISRHRLAIARWHRAPGPSAATMAPCLALELRPVFPVVAARPVAGPLAAPCDGCGVARVCSRARAHEEGPVPGLRPLRHADGVGAVWAGIDAVSSAFGKRVPRSVEALVLDLIAMRRGVASGPQTPFELSLKIDDGQLVPAVRLVEYAPPAFHRRDPREARRARTDALARIASHRLDVDRRDALVAWLELLERHAPSGVEMSIGLDAPLDERITPALQLYAHVEPADRTAMRALAGAALAWSGVEPTRIDVVHDLLEMAGPDGDRPELTLLTFSPTPKDARRSKLYFALPLAAEHGPSGLVPLPSDPLESFAPGVGLAVLETNAGVPSWRKRDFPNIAHFQDARASFAAFCSGLAEEDRARAERIVDGERFAAWPTWLSVGATSPGAAAPVRTFYFVPR